MTRYLLFLGFAICIQSLSAQVVTTIPLFPTADEPVTIVYDATQGNGALEDVPPPIYAHTGLITQDSDSPSDWKYVQGVWGTADPEVLMSVVGDNIYQITYPAGIRTFYGAAADDTIYQMAFVFRTEDGGIVGRAEDGSDIYADVYAPGLNVAITSPAADPLIVETGDNVHIEAISTFSDSLYLIVNDIVLVATEDSSIIYDFTAISSGLSLIEVIAKDDEETKIDSSWFYVRPPVTIAPVPSGLVQGVNYMDDNTVTLVLYAPYKEYVFAIGEHCDWMLSDDIYMKLDPDMATFWVTLTGLIPGKEYAYQYFVDGELSVADPLAEKVIDPWNDGFIPESTYPELLPYPSGKTTGVVSVFQTAVADYNWVVEDFIPPTDEDLVVYELLVRDFIAARNYQTLTDTLHYLKTLGVNAIELMPVMEFEGNESWGYNPSFFTALDKYYGTRDAFKVFIDSCHASGIAVILDIAMNHAFGQCPLVQLWWDAALNVPAANSPYFNQYPTHDYNVGYDFNHQSPATINLRNQIFGYWLNEYHVDGYRFDLSKGYTQNNTLGDVGAWGLYDASRIATWKSIGDTLWSINPNAKLILEHFAENSEEEELSNYGFMLWGNINYNYAQGTMGYSGSDISWGSYQARGWDDPHVMTYMESHDEERLMFKNITYGNSTNPEHDVKDLNTALYRMELAGAFFFTIPGPKMIWQFGELGYDYSIEYGCRVCNKPVRWDYYDDNNRLRIYQVWSELIKLKKTYAAFRTTNYSLNVSGLSKRINLNDDEMNVTVLGNFNIYLGEVVPNFQHTGWWYEYFSGDSINVTNVSSALALNPGEYRLYTDERLVTPEIISDINVLHSNGPDVFVYPNPSSDVFTFETFLTETADITMEIFSISGDMIYSNQLSNQSPGILHFTWDGNNMYGQRPPAGIYFCKLYIGNELVTLKLNLL